MARMVREDVFAPDEIAIVHVMNRVVRRCFLLGTDPATGINYDHRKAQMEALFQRFAALFGIDLLVYAILSNHFHTVLRSRPDVVATWSDTDVARRWMLACPDRKEKDGTAKEPTEAELNRIRCGDRLGDTASSLKSSRGHSIFLARCPGLGQWPGYLRFVAAA